jgi:AcrR family transcriptional regulator
MAGRRMGPTDAAVRFRLLDATERVIARDGYPAVTSRNVGSEAGVDQKLVYYYFRTMEELVVATFHRRSESFLTALEEIAASDKPVSRIWQVSSDRSGRLMMEFMAMATRNPALQAEVRDYSLRANAIIEGVLTRELPKTKLDRAVFTPAFMNFLIASLARNLISEGELGILPDPEQHRGEMAAWLDDLGL